MNSVGEPPLWPYSHRNGAQVAEDAAVLLAPPEIELTAEERFVAGEYARALFAGSLACGAEVVPRIDDGRIQGLDGVSRISVAAASDTYYASYFDTSEGAEALRASYVASDGEFLRDPKLAVKSEAWFIDEMMRRLASDPQEDAAQPDALKIYEISDPDAVLDKFEQIQGYRDYYRQARRELRSESGAGSSPLDQARKVLLDVHVAKVDAMAAAMYPTIIHLSQQVEAMEPGEERDVLWQRLSAAASTVTKASTDDFARRLDLVRNGAAWVGDGISPISPDVTELASRLDMGASVEVASEPVVSAELVDELDAVTWGASETKEFIEAILGEWDLLSGRQADWETVRKRSGKAEDDKWQVIVTPKRLSLSVDGKKKVVNVPESFSRTLVQQGEAGVLPVTAHELKHVLQCEYDNVLAESLPLAGLKGRRSVTMRELGGILEEREMREMLGQDRRVYTTYLNGLIAKLAGANQTEAARAFLSATDPRHPMGRRIRNAGKNTLRLYRNAGHNSQPLDYIEQAVILEGLTGFTDEEVRAITTAGGSFSLADSAALHRAGLLDLPRAVSERPARDVLRIYFERFYDGPNRHLVDTGRM